MAESRRLLETDPDKAIQVLQETLESVKAADVSDAAKRTMVRRVEVALELAKKDKVSFDAKMKDKKYQEEIERKKLRILEADKAKQEQITALMKKAKEMEADGNLAEAEQLAKRAAAIDPNNIAAVALAKVSNTRRHMERYLDNKSAKEESFLEAMHGADEAAIAPTDAQRRGIAFPKDFGPI